MIVQDEDRIREAVSRGEMLYPDAGAFLLAEIDRLRADDNPSRDLKRGEVVVLMTIFSLEELKASGLVEGGNLDLSTKAKWLCRQLRAIGWTPTEQEVHATMEMLKAEGHIAN